MPVITEEEEVHALPTADFSQLLGLPNLDFTTVAEDVFGGAGAQPQAVTCPTHPERDE
jgi:hypothetical protein